MKRKQNTIPLSSVKINGGFLADIQNLIASEVLPYQWAALNDEIVDAQPSHSIRNLEIAAGRITGEFYGEVFQDSDLAKWLEAACYCMIIKPDDQLQKKIDFAVELIADAQMDDGYLNTYFSMMAPEKRWTNLQECHEMYCLGHFMEAAVAHYQATGSNQMLDIMERAFDQMASVIGPEEGKIHGYPGHPEIELALMRMYEVTGREKYAAYADYLVDVRGKQPFFYDEEQQARGYIKYPENIPFGRKYTQSHMPIVDQVEAAGHAVRALYLFSGVLDAAAHHDHSDLLQTMSAVYEDITTKKMFITGGVGSTHVGEAFTSAYDLPNALTYNETCASIALGMFSDRLCRLYSQAKYADVLERVLYNGIISSMSMDGKRFFYVNPLQVNPAIQNSNPDYNHVKTERQQWFGCACCPPNVARYYMSVGDKLYTSYEDTLFINLYAQSEVCWNGNKLTLHTNYPADGNISITANCAKPCKICLRIPDWCENHTLSGVAGAVLENGYLEVQLPKGTHQFELSLEMKPKRIWSNTLVSADAGRIALQYGPIVYCIESVDNGDRIDELCLLHDSDISIIENGFAWGLPELEADGLREHLSGSLYSSKPPTQTPVKLRLVPYFAWGNRGKGEMAVWIRER